MVKRERDCFKRTTYVRLNIYIYIVNSGYAYRCNARVIFAYTNSLSRTWPIDPDATCSVMPQGQSQYIYMRNSKVKRFFIHSIYR